MVNCDFATGTKPRAAKNYLCVCCGGVIPKGVVHHKFVQSFDGDFSSCRAHSECQQLWRVLYQDLGVEDGMPWELSEALRDWTDGADEAQEILDGYRGF